LERTPKSDVGLINMQGEVVGISSAIFSKSVDYMDIGFAIPISRRTLGYTEQSNHSRFFPFDRHNGDATIPGGLDPLALA
jgi:hypothetical protein